MNVKEIKNYKEQDSALGKHLRGTSGIELSHAQLLEAVASMQNAPDWNALVARESVRAPMATAALEKPATAKELLDKALDGGLTFGDAVNAFSARQGEAETAYANYARNNLSSDGEIEFDDPCIVSMSDEGAYVMGWTWCPISRVRDELPLPELADLPLLMPKFIAVLDDDGDENEATGISFVVKDDIVNLVVLDGDEEVLSIPLKGSDATIERGDNDDNEDSDSSTAITVSFANWEVQLQIAD